MSYQSYLKSLIVNPGENAWECLLLKILECNSYLERPNNPQKWLASFAKERAIQRMEASKNRNLETFGIPELVGNLGKIPENVYVDFYGVENSEYTGECIVFNRKLVGCEFVKKGMARTIKLPPDWDGSLKNLYDQ